MSFSQGVRFTISADSSKIRSEFGKVEQAAQATGKKVDQAMKAQQAAIQSIANTRRRTEYDQASTIGKIRVVTKQLREDAQTMAKLEQGSVTWLKSKERIETNLAHLRGLQLKAQKEMQAGAPSAPGSSEGGKSAVGSLGEGLVKRVIWLGAGAALSGLINAIRAHFESKAEIAEAQAAASGASLASTRARIGAQGGLPAQLQQGQKTVEDMQAMRDMQQSLVKDLSTGFQGALTVISPESLKILTEAESTVYKMNADIQKQHDANALLERDILRQKAIRESINGYEGGTGKGGGYNANGARRIGSVSVGTNTGGSLGETERAMSSGGLNAVTAAQIELRRRIAVQKSEKKLGTFEQQKEAEIAVREQAITLAQARNNMALFGANFRQGITADAASGRTFRNGAARPLSETERLARRAQQMRTRADNLILTGATGSGAGHAIDAARLTESAVAGRLSRASSGVSAPPGVTDFTALKAEIANSNKILKSIDDALKPTAVK